MCAGLIPGVNIRTRPRVLFMFIQSAVDESMFRVGLAMLASPYIKIEKHIKMAYDHAVPPLSSQASLEKDIAKMNAIYENIKLHNKKKKK